MTDDLPRRLRRELKTVRTMIGIYCRGHHAPDAPLCPDCSALWHYSRERVHRCPFGEAKSTCAKCTVHCYKPEMRERIREVMRYAGPRMPARHPVLTLYHFLDGRRPTPGKPGS
jgi:predicted amidophosphoribosyltransferase